VEALSYVERARTRAGVSLRLARRADARAALEKIVAWDFERSVIAHVDLIEHEAKAVARRAWRCYICRRRPRTFESGMRGPT
jgi:hypothetical protein